MREMDTEDYLPLPLYVFETRIFEGGREEGFVVPVRGALDHCYLMQMTDDPTDQRRNHSPSAESPLSGYLSFQWQQKGLWALRRKNIKTTTVPGAAVVSGSPRLLTTGQTCSQRMPTVILRPWKPLQGIIIGRPRRRYEPWEIVLFRVIPHICRAFPVSSRSSDNLQLELHISSYSRNVFYDKDRNTRFVRD